MSMSELRLVLINIVNVVLTAMAKNHTASRTVAQWVVWAHSEGMPDIIEHTSDAGVQLRQ